jgi:peptide chain release factor 2
MSAPDFWSNRERAQGEVEEVSRLRSLLNPFRELERAVVDFDALQQLAAEETNSASRAQIEKDAATEYARLLHEIEDLSFASFFRVNTTDQTHF